MILLRNLIPLISNGYNNRILIMSSLSGDTEIQLQRGIFHLVLIGSEEMEQYLEIPVKAIGTEQNMIIVYL